MTAWELRQQMESSYPWWAPFALAGVILVIAFVVNYWNKLWL